MIRVFFSAGGSARIACIRLSSPPLIFRTAFLFLGAKVARFADYQWQQAELASSSCIRSVELPWQGRKRRWYSGRRRGRFRECPQRSRERPRCCRGPIFFHFARDQFSYISTNGNFCLLCCVSHTHLQRTLFLRFWVGPIFFNFFKSSSNASCVCSCTGPFFFQVQMSTARIGFQILFGVTCWRNYYYYYYYYYHYHYCYCYSPNRFTCMGSFGLNQSEVVRIDQNWASTYFRRKLAIFTKIFL